MALSNPHPLKTVGPKVSMWHPPAPTPFPHICYTANTMKIRAALLLCTSFASGLLATHAQKPASNPAKPDYSRESSIIEHLTRVYRYAADGTGSKEITGVIDVRDEASVKAWSVLSFSFASSAEDFTIDYVRVRRPDGTLIPTPAADAQQLPSAVTREAPFYSDLKEEQIPVRSLQPGDHLEYRFLVTRNRPEAPNQFWGQEAVFTPSSGVVALDEVIELHLPASKYANVWSPRLKPTITEAAGERIYRWQSSQLHPIAGLTRNQLLVLDNYPDLGTSDDPRLPPIAWTSFHSWPEVGAWYRSLEGSRTQPDDDVRSRVATLIAGKSTAEDKARAIYGFVGPQIRYIGVAFGIGRFQPHEAGDVLRNQYGDCKDKTTLLVSMLTLAGIPTDAVLVGAGVPFNPDVPSPGSFNHAINLAHVDGQPAWLDATSEVAPYRLLLPQIRGVKALVIPLTGDAHIETTPTDPPFPMVDHFTAIGSLDDQGTSHSHITLDLRGDNEVAFRVGAHAISPAQWDEAMQRVSQAMSFSGKVTNAKLSRADDTSKPFHIEYDYEREKNGDWDNLRILPQLIPVGLGDVDEKDPPVTPIEIGYPHVEIAHAEMKLPKDWSADLPASVHAKSSFATLDKTYKFENGTITTERRFEVLKKNIPASEWHAYHSWFLEAKLDGELYIQLVSHTSSLPSTPSRAVNDPAAAQQLQNAITSCRAKDFSACKSSIDKARKINPNQPGLWMAYAGLARMKGEKDEFIKDADKELALQPNNSAARRFAAQNEMQIGKPEAAISTLQAGVALNPADTDNVLYLAAILHARADYTAEEAALRSGLSATPDNKNLKLRLGINLVHQKKAAEGEAMLHDPLTNGDDPGQLNDAAYELGDASLDLTLADKAARRALDLLDKASSTGETGVAALRRTELIFSAWDTFGWILFREGKTDEAAPWIRASWRNAHSSEVGLHLALLLEKQNRPSDALTQLELAQVGSSGVSETEVSRHIKSEIASLKSAGTVAPKIENPGMTLQNERTYQFPRGPIHSTADISLNIELAVTNKGTTSATVLYGDDTLKPLVPAAQALDLHLDVPAASNATILRRAVLSCHGTPTCELVLIPPISAIQEP
jgi:tetratricopeptide (TPR) repeat protein/transglutaminase-like putative cysteine protease